MDQPKVRKIVKYLKNVWSRILKKYWFFKKLFYRRFLFGSKLGSKIYFHSLEIKGFKNLLTWGVGGAEDSVTSGLDRWLERVVDSGLKAGAGTGSFGLGLDGVGREGIGAGRGGGGGEGSESVPWKVRDQANNST